MKSQSGNVRILRISTVAHSRRRVVLKRFLIHYGAEKGQFSAHRQSVCCQFQWGWIIMVQRSPNCTSPMQRSVSNKWSVYCSCERELVTFAANAMTVLLQFIESGALSSERFQNILERHALAGSWRKFDKQFLESCHLKSPRSSTVSKPIGPSWQHAR